MGTPNNKKERNKSTLIYGILILALIATWAYIYWDKSNSSQKQEALQSQVQEMDSSRSAVKEQYQATLVKIDMLKSANDSIMSTKTKEIDDLKARIQNILSKQNSSQADLAEARKLIDELKNRIAGYKEEIERLTGENVTLTKQRNTIRTQRDSIQSSYNTVSEKNDSLNQQIKLAAILQVDSFKITPIHVKNSGKEKATDKAKRTDIIRISFNIEKNRVTPSGKKELYICINSPKGTPIAVEKLGSGKFTLHDGTEKLYTLKKVIEYTQGEKLPVTLDWKQPSDFKTGTYTIEVYEKGREIGNGKVKLEEGFLFF